jgi:peroxiredoxin
MEELKNWRTDMSLLSPQDPFPTLVVSRLGGGTLTIPEVFAGHFGVVLFYRGSWCPYCNAQLRAFQRATEAFDEIGAKVVALSIDDESATEELVAKHGLTFSIGHSANARAIAEVTGAFVDPDVGFLQSTGFIVDPDGRVVLSVYSSGAIGRLVPDDVLGFLRYLSQHAPSS